MKCSLTGQNTRVLAKSINSFSRIGGELFLEASPNGLTLRTVNDSKTAFAVINFETGFFTEYKIARCNSDENSNKCKISMKSCLGVFKSLRQVEKCQITLNSNTSKLLFKFDCMFHTTKTHNVSILEHETLSAIFMRDNVPNTITAPYKLFNEIIGNFRMYDSEITIEAATDSVILKNHIDMQTSKQLMRTKLALKPQEFQNYRITEPTTITFCLKEFRAILNFADALSLDLTVNFETAGKAVVFAFGNKDSFTANFVMSTLSLDETSDCYETNRNETLKATNAKQNETALNSSGISRDTSIIINNVIDLEDDDASPRRSAAKVLHSTKPTRGIEEGQRSLSKAIPTECVRVSTTRSRSPMQKKKTSNPESNSEVLIKESESEEIRVFFRPESETTTEDCDLELEIPGSPKPLDTRRRRLRKIFPRCFQDTQYAEDLTGKTLAEMTDDEHMK